MVAKPTRQVNYRVMVNWTGSALSWFVQDVFYDPATDISAYTDVSKGIEVARGRDPSRSLGQPAVPQLKISLDNQDRRFSNSFTGSPYYGRVQGGRPIGLDILHGPEYSYEADISYQEPNVWYRGRLEKRIFTGRTEDIENNAEAPPYTVDISALGMLGLLQQTEKVSTPVFQNITTGDALAVLLDTIGWPAAKRRISGQATLLQWWWLDEANALTAALELLMSEGAGAALYESEEGGIEFEGRDYRTLALRSLQTQATYQPSNGPYYIKEPKLAPGLRDVVNRCYYETKQRAYSIKQVWQYSGSLVLAPSTSATLYISTTDPFGGPICVAGTDYTVTAGSVTSASVAQTSACRATLVITAGVGGATVTGLQVRASSLAVTSEQTVQNNIDTSGSQLLSGVQDVTLKGRAEVDPNMAIDLCNSIVQRYAAPRELLTVTLSSIDSDYVQEMISRQISDRVHIIEPQTGVDFDAWIEGLRWELDGDLLNLAIMAEKVVAQGYARWGTAVWGTDVWGV